VALPEGALPVVLPEKIEITQEGGSPLGKGAGVCEHDVPGVRRPGAARDGHDGHVRRFELVLYRYVDAKNAAAPFATDKVNYWFPIDQVHRRRGACDSAFDLLAILDEGDAGSGDGEE